MTNLASRAFDFCVSTERANGSRLAYIRSSDTNVLTVDFAAPEPLPAGTTDLLAFLDEFDADPEMAAGLPDARKDVGAAFEAHEGVTIRSLRLLRGLSQADLAIATKTSQAAISAIENRTRKPGEDTIRDIAKALDVDFNTLMEALANG